MAFTEQKWEYSDEVVEEREFKSVPYGERNLFIKDAVLTEDKVYILTLTDLEDEECETQFRFWLNTTDKMGNLIKNTQARGTLISLGEALAGKPIGIPHPSSVVGGVVHAEVKESKPTQDGKIYPRIYKFEPVPEEVAMCAAIDQYYIGAVVE